MRDRRAHPPESVPGRRYLRGARYPRRAARSQVILPEELPEFPFVFAIALGAELGARQAGNALGKALASRKVPDMPARNAHIGARAEHGISFFGKRCYRCYHEGVVQS